MQLCATLQQMCVLQHLASLDLEGVAVSDALDMAGEHVVGEELHAWGPISCSGQGAGLQLSSGPAERSQAVKVVDQKCSDAISRLTCDRDRCAVLDPLAGSRSAFCQGPKHAAALEVKS